MEPHSSPDVMGAETAPRRGASPETRSSESRRVRTFLDDRGQTWVARVRERAGRNYKARFFLFLAPEGGGEKEGVSLIDVRWNSERTARRTLETMSEVELRRRLRSASGRGRPAALI